MKKQTIITTSIGLGLAGLGFFLGSKQGRERTRRAKKKAAEVGLRSAELIYGKIPTSLKTSAAGNLAQVAKLANGKTAVDGKGYVYSTNSLNRKFRYGVHVIRALASTGHPLQAQIIPTRRCNLACLYCNEYDHVSDPVDVQEMIGRIDRLAALGTSIVIMSGGEPMLHPEIFRLIARVREHGMIAGLITNGTYLQREKIWKLNDAGLDELQISIDNVEPDDISQKSLKLLDSKLVNLKKYAKFRVNINSVLGSGVKNPSDALIIAARARHLGFTSTIGIIHDGEGALKNGLENGLSPTDRLIYETLQSLPRARYARFNKGFQDELAAGRELVWRCRSGSRYLYIDEDGFVNWCSQQRGIPGTPLMQYTQSDLDREYLTEKHCAPTCTIQCVHQTAIPDQWRDPQISLKEYMRRVSSKAVSSATIRRVLSEAES
jgi:MoaA/NifB/PqqE/SkfB family radical SAM enzyme